MLGRSWWKVVGVAVPVLALAFAGGVSAQDQKPQDPKKPAAPAKPADDKKPTADAPKAPAKDIVVVATEAGNFKTLAELLQVAGLVETLKGPGPFTVFAPTDEAFAKLPKGALDDLKKDPKKLASILTYHVVKGANKSDAVTKMKTAKTVNGAEIKITVKDGKVIIDEKSNVTSVDVMASNGVIHVIDTVLMPADKPAAPAPAPKKPDAPKPDAPKAPGGGR